MYTTTGTEHLAKFEVVREIRGCVFRGVLRGEAAAQGVHWLTDTDNFEFRQVLCACRGVHCEAC